MLLILFGCLILVLIAGVFWKIDKTIFELCLVIYAVLFGAIAFNMIGYGLWSIL